MNIFSRTTIVIRKDLQCNSIFLDTGIYLTETYSLHFGKTVLIDYIDSDDNYKFYDTDGNLWHLEMTEGYTEKQGTDETVDSNKLVNFMLNNNISFEEAIAALEWWKK